MACEVQINSINYLQKEGAIDQTNKIVDQELFNNLNDKLTSLAEMKYGLEAYGEKLFTTRLSKALPNDILFQNFQDKFNQKAGQPMMMREASVTQNENSYYRGQIEQPYIDSKGDLILYGKDDPLYKKAGLSSLGVSMTDDLKLAIEYGKGQLEGAEKRFEDEWGYDIVTWEAQDALHDLLETGYFIIQINKNVSDKIVEENNEVKLLGGKIVVPKGQYKIEKVSNSQIFIKKINIKII